MQLIPAKAGLVPLETEVGPSVDSMRLELGVGMLSGSMRLEFGWSRCLVR